MVDPTDVVFLTDTSGFATTSDGNIYRDDRLGVLVEVGERHNRPVRAISFATDKIGYAVGDSSLFLKTTDGGATWTPKDIGGAAPADLTSVKCATDKVCVVTTRTGTTLGITTDGAETPMAFPTPSTDPILTAAFASPTRLAAAGQQGSTVVSDDVGATFKPIGGRLVGRFTRIRAGQVAGSAFAPGPTGRWARPSTAARPGRAATSRRRRTCSTCPSRRDRRLRARRRRRAVPHDDGGQTWKTLDTGSTARARAVTRRTPRR